MNYRVAFVKDRYQPFRTRSIYCANKELKGTRCDVSEVQKTPGWERVRVQIALGATDAVAQRSIARDFELKDTAMPKNGIGCIAADGKQINNCGERRTMWDTNDSE